MILTINKTWTCQQACNAQNNKRSDSPRLQTLAKDTISFKAREQSFLTKLRELCKRDWNAHLAGEVEGLAHDVDPKHPDIVAEFKKMKSDSSIGKGLKAWIFDDLTKELGAGGNKKL